MRLGRTTSGGTLIPEVDGLRLVAIAAVFLYHLSGYVVTKWQSQLVWSGASNWLRQRCETGSFGVPLFFAISGFILALPFARHAFQRGSEPSIGQFYLRRASRLVPPYLINLTVCLVLLWLVNGRSLVELLPRFLVSAAYGHALVFDEPSPLNIVTWSLEAEFQFYLLAPFLLRIFRWRFTTGRWAVLAGVGAACILLRSDSMRTHASVIGGAEFFVIGILAAEFFVRRWEAAPPGSTLGDAAAIAGLLLAVTVWAHLPGPLALLKPVIIGLLLVGTLTGSMVRRGLQNPFAVVTGGMGYTIYLYHLLAISLFGRFILPRVGSESYPATLGWLLVTVAPLVWLGCAGIFLLSEKPFMQRDWWRRPKLERRT